jgi:hypothetical protein
MKLFHRTWAAFAVRIIESGFVDNAEGHVWMSDEPLDAVHIKGGTGGDVLLVVDIPDEAVQSFPVLQRKEHRAIKIPAEYLNKFKPEVNETDYDGFSRAELTERISQLEVLERENNSVVSYTSNRVTSQSLRNAIVLLEKSERLT